MLWDANLVAASVSTLRVVPGTDTTNGDNIKNTVKKNGNDLFNSMTRPVCKIWLNGNVPQSIDWCRGNDEIFGHIVGCNGTNVDIVDLESTIQQRGRNNFETPNDTAIDYSTANIHAMKLRKNYQAIVCSLCRLKKIALTSTPYQDDKAIEISQCPKTKGAPLCMAMPRTQLLIPYQPFRDCKRKVSLISSSNIYHRISACTIQVQQHGKMKGERKLLHVKDTRSSTRLRKCTSVKAHPMEISAYKYLNSSHIRQPKISNFQTTTLILKKKGKPRQSEYHSLNCWCRIHCAKIVLLYNNYIVSIELC